MVLLLLEVSGDGVSAGAGHCLRLVAGSSTKHLTPVHGEMTAQLSRGSDSGLGELYSGGHIFHVWQLATARESSCCSMM